MPSGRRSSTSAIARRSLRGRTPARRRGRARRSAACELRAAVEAIDDDPERLAALQERRAQLADLRRKHVGDARAPLGRPVRGSRRPHRAPGGARAATRDRARGGRSGSRATPLPRWRRPRPTVGDATATPCTGPRRRGAGAARASSALAKAQVQLEVGAEDPGDDVRLPARAQPRPARGAAGQGGVGWRAGPHHAGAPADRREPECPPSCSTRSTPASAARRPGRWAGRWRRWREGKQVLVVTHLPQVAAFADAQVALTKHDDGATTVMRAEGLDGRAPSAGARPDALRARRQRHRPGPRRGAARHRGSGAGPMSGAARRARRHARRGDLRLRQGRQAHEGPDQAPRARRHRGDRPRRPRPGRRRRPHRRRGRRRRQRVAVDHRPLPERRAAPARASRRASSSTTSGSSVMDAVADGQPVRLDGGDRAGRRRGAGDRPRARRGRDRATDGGGARRHRRRAPALRREHARVRPARGRARVRADRAAQAPHVDFAGRHALVVVRGHDYKQDLPGAPAATSGSSGRCSSASTAAPTPCSRWG